ncbi:MAG: peptide-methionine (S)-S-oxide reductase MsrA [Candidatus Eremiobacteraeota bacterium]|nr:peptide-methionine (S)-S-oxide reductase MsrA [Candidatus Eremiobacteraeota bacterium]
MKARISAILALILVLTVAPVRSGTTDQRVVLAGGCFWGMQAVFESLRGVRSAVAGYSGGNAVTAHYEIVSTGMTGHAESVYVTFDPSVISFKQLLDVYFLVAHDPTELNRQGPDEGSQYRSEIYYTTQSQHDLAVEYVSSLERRHVYASPIVTKLEPFRAFYPAESYHQDFALHNPGNAYIVINDLPKLRNLREQFPQLVNPNARTAKLGS